ANLEVADFVNIPPAPPKQSSRKKPLPPAPEEAGPSNPISVVTVLGYPTPGLPPILTQAPIAKGIKSKKKNTVQVVATDPSNTLAGPAPKPKPRQCGTTLKSQNPNNTNTALAAARKSKATKQSRMAAEVHNSMADPGPALESPPAELPSPGPTPAQHAPTPPTPTSPTPTPPAPTPAPVPGPQVIQPPSPPLSTGSSDSHTRQRKKSPPWHQAPPSEQALGALLGVNHAGDRQEHTAQHQQASQPPPCNCALLTGSEHEKESKEGDHRINAPDIKYFFQQDMNGRRAQNHLGLGIDIHTYGMETSNGMVREHLKKHRKSHQWWCMKYSKPDQTKLGKKEAKARDEAACMVAKAQQQTRMRPKFSEEILKAALVSFIVADDQTLNVIECHEFRELLLLLQEDLRESDIPNQHAKGSISLTIDLWSDQIWCPYIAITAHWMKKDGNGHLSLESALIAFHHALGCHDGPNLANIVIHLLDRVGITKNVGHITMDNADNCRADNYYRAQDVLKFEGEPTRSERRK
ncbi:hypothetical protein BDN67DRAFT_985665, partial [Paxillus ammoniavirescens]